MSSIGATPGMYIDTLETSLGGAGNFAQTLMLELGDILRGVLKVLTMGFLSALTTRCFFRFLESIM